MRCLYGTPLDKVKVKKQIRSGSRKGEVTLGEELLIHRYFFATKYIRYQDIRRAFVRIESGEYGEFPLDEHSLVLVDAGGAEHVLHVGHPGYAQRAVEWMSARFGHIAAGKERKTEEK